MEGSRRSFLADRMLGTLAHYLRFMDYDTFSADQIEPGNSREDTILLGIAERDGRVLLTRDRELSGRSMESVYLESQVPAEQVAGLVAGGWIDRDFELRMHRCTLCNGILRKASRREVESCEYAPSGVPVNMFAWCPSCRKLYWMGSHAKMLEKKLRDAIAGA